MPADSRNFEAGFYSPVGCHAFDSVEKSEKWPPTVWFTLDECLLMADHWRPSPPVEGQVTIPFPNSNGLAGHGSDGPGSTHNRLSAFSEATKSRKFAPVLVTKKAAVCRGQRRKT